jgi:hypothetical protein
LPLDNSHFESTLFAGRFPFANSRPRRGTGNLNITAYQLKGNQPGDNTYKVHLDDYDQTPMVTGRGLQDVSTGNVFAGGWRGPPVVKMDIC